MLRALAGLAALALSALPAQAQVDTSLPLIVPEPYEVPATPGLRYPQVTVEADLRLFMASNPRQAAGPSQGTQIFGRGEVLTGIHLSPQFSIQASLHMEPVQEVFPNGGVTGFRYAGGFIDSLYLDWHPTDTLRFEIGKFTAPFGYGYHYFPGILPRWRAHEVYWIQEADGAGGTWTFLSDPRFGEHDLSAALFTRDRSFLSNTFVTRRPCCYIDAERYQRETAAVGGPGNTGRLNNFSIALDGDRFGWLPNFSYHLAVLSRGPGQNGTARELGLAAGARYERVWSRDLRTLFFFEYVQFNNANGRPLVTDDATGATVPQQTTRRFTTAGVRQTFGPWRTALVYQQDLQKQAVNPTPTQRFYEISFGRTIIGSLGFDIGYQYSRVPRESGQSLFDNHTFLAMLTWQPSVTYP